MATLTNVNPKKNEEEEDLPQTGQSSSMISPTSQVGGSAVTGVQKGTPGSGRFTNIQKYMGANQNAGSQLGQAIGQNVDRSVTKTTGAANKAQTGYQAGIGTGQQEMGKINDYTQNLSQKQDAPAEDAETKTLSNVTGPAYLASGYQANLGNRANYAQQLAGDEDQLNTFLNYRSGKIASDQNKALQDQENTAKTTTDAASQNFLKTQEQLKNPNQRGALLSDVARSRTYGTGQQSLDKAFLQMDKNNTVGNVQKDVQQKEQQFNAANKLPQLTEQGAAVRTGLGESTTGLQKQTDQNLADLSADVNSRQEQMNAARGNKLNQLNEGFNTLRNTSEANPEIAELFGLQDGQRLFNSLRDLPSINNLIDTSGLSSMANSQSDLANKGDVDLYKSFAKLAQTNAPVTSASTLGDIKALPGIDMQKLLTDTAEGNKQYFAGATPTSGFGMGDSGGFTSSMNNTGQLYNNLVDAGVKTEADLRNYLVNNYGSLQQYAGDLRGTNSRYVDYMMRGEANSAMVPFIQELRNRGFFNTVKNKV